MYVHIFVLDIIETISRKLQFYLCTSVYWQGIFIQSYAPQFKTFIFFSSFLKLFRIFAVIQILTFCFYQFFCTDFSACLLLSWYFVITLFTRGFLFIFKNNIYIYICFSVSFIQKLWFWLILTIFFNFDISAWINFCFVFAYVRFNCFL